MTLDLRGHRNGKIVCVEPTEDRIGGSILWKCACDCGTEILLPASKIKRERNSTPLSCEECWISKGEVRELERLRKKQEREDFKSSIEYKQRCQLKQVYDGMKRRCYNDKDQKFHDYGGRGITICDRWLESFENFVEDMGYRPYENYSIDRINPNLGYSPENCRWADPCTQSFNTRKGKNNKSGKTGVIWKKDKQKWKAIISINGIERFLGYFDNKEDAINARLAAEIEVYGFNKP